jgi:hypothetical protein
VNDRAFRLDFFIAIAAVLVSAFTAGILIYQTRVIGDQFAATIWPYLSVGSTYDSNGETIEVANDGVGPALVRSAQLRVDGGAVRAWNDYVRVLFRDPGLRSNLLRTRAAVLAGKTNRSILSMSSIGPSSTLRPGESETLLKLWLIDRVPTPALTKHSITIDLCYCSLNGSCWTLHANPGLIDSQPRPVSQCASSAAIESNPFTQSAPKTRAATR